MKKIKIYSKQDCPMCKMTKKVLDKDGVDYEVVDLSESNDETQKHLTYLKEELGYSSLPVIVLADNTHFNGFQPAKLKGLK